MPLSIYEMEDSYGRYHFGRRYDCAERCDHRTGGHDAQEEVSRKAGGKGNERNQN